LIKVPILAAGNPPDLAPFAFFEADAAIPEPPGPSDTLAVNLGVLRLSPRMPQPAGR
jgi:hypothetical protein